MFEEAVIKIKEENTKVKNFQKRIRMTRISSSPKGACHGKSGEISKKEGQSFRSQNALEAEIDNYLKAASSLNVELVKGITGHIIPIEQKELSVARSKGKWGAVGQSDITSNFTPCGDREIIPFKILRKRRLKRSLGLVLKGLAEV